LNNIKNSFIYRIINKGLIFLREILLKFFAETLKAQPDTLTITGILVSLGSAYLFSQGLFILGGIFLIISGLFDVFDGLVAKRYNRGSKFGSLLDSTSDRYVEIFQLAGLIYYFNKIGIYQFSYIALLYILGSVLTSYTRAKIESLGKECNIGFIQRLERLTLFVTFSILSFFDKRILFYGILLIGIGANITAIQRILYGKKVLKD
jgi:archaetidylinositol phosphate synthase